MFKFILGIFSAVLVVGLFIYLKKVVFNKASTNLELFSTTEKFEWKKLKKSLHLHNKVEWAKDLSSLFNLRKLLIYGAIIGSIYGYGYWKALRNQPINIPLQYGREVKIKIDDSYLHIKKDGSVVIESPDGKVIKTIAVKDIDNLKKELRPLGFTLDPIFISGGGFGTDGVGYESGIGISWLRYFRGRIESFVTNKGIYPLAVAYKITKNSGAGIGVGKAWKNADNRIIIYWRWEF